MITKLELAEKSYKVDFGGRELLLETGKLALLAPGSVKATCGGTVVLATCVISDEPREGIDFFPLLVDYEERFYAAGKISGSRFIKREGRPSDAAVLACRMIDRPLRPLFPKNYRNDVQVIITVLSYDGENDPDIISMIAASTAIMQTKAPFSGPIGAIKVGLFEDGFKINPTLSELENSKLDLTIAATSDKVMMIEAEANEVAEEKIIEAIELAKKVISPQLEIQKKIAKEHQETPSEVELIADETIHGEVSKIVGDKLKTAVRELDKIQREEKLKEFEAEVLATLEGNYKQIELKASFTKLVEKEICEAILKDDLRPDGRAIEEIRPIAIEVGLLPRTHGSGLFTRGQTQALTVATLASPGMEQFIDTMEADTTKKFMHHYNFPPFSTGEVSPVRGASRREIGHGYLAEKALRPMIPDTESFPYTIRLVTEILTSNGSSSMAATCGATLALMDAGVPIKKPVAGIAMGLVVDKTDESKFKVLTDLQGLEDFAGDMDFKIAGTCDGITAIQMDTKINGLSNVIVVQTFKQAKTARLEILEEIAKVIPQPRKELSKFAPRIKAIKINPEKIGDIIGPGGKNIRKIIEECGGKEVTSIDIDDDGTVMIASTDAEMGEKAISIVTSMTREIEIGEIIEGEVVDIKCDRMTGKQVGAIVQITPRQDGMIHISQIAKERVEDIGKYLKIGQIVKAKVVDVDREKGR
ncbi:MAG: polyribonucleotide nucleotidyltransferase [Candidatus Berkelbacteria bacterium Athens1014_28]|uniref:Polyribonucleotide nucleotidyltransferase n=1 Tax=Candidatus Berkelbacteria bacterium Athens1014_28 TaxID=2017145 RepID=A0A554LLW8_9BACT|nr:MAG: polyribonucleotide nucleotidyltransferase [Candidatus Berkelbacteria bacterium Athens1014_28]